MPSLPCLSMINTAKSVTTRSTTFSPECFRSLGHPWRNARRRHRRLHGGPLPPNNKWRDRWSQRETTFDTLPFHM
jgi:hypothetical protein